MADQGKTRRQLLAELEEAQRTIAELKAALLAHPDREQLHLNISDDSKYLTKPNQALKNEPDESRSLEELAKNSEERFLSFVELSTEGIWLLEVEQPVSTRLPEDQQIELFYKHSSLAECNKAMAEMYGLSNPQEIIGARLGDLLIPSDPNNIEYLRTFIRSGYNLTDAESHETDAQGNEKYFLNNLLGIVENGFVLRAWGTQRDITEAKHINEALRASENRFRTLAETASDAIITIDETGIMAFLNQAAEKIFGYSIADMKGKDLTMLMPEYLRHLHQAGFNRYKETGKRHISWEGTELLGLHKNGTEIPLQISFGEYFLNEKRFFTGIVRDISESKGAQALILGQQVIMELVAKGIRLEDVLEVLALFIESQLEGMACSIELVNEDTTTMSVGAAPNLPDELIQMIEGMKISPTGSSCGAAMTRKEIVISSDIANDPLWVDLADKVLPHGFRACWSTPIFSKSGQVLGSFGMLFKRICTPREPDYRLMEISTRLAGIAIDSHLAVVNLRESEERYRTLYENNPLMIFTVDAEGTILLVNEFGAQQLGYSAEELIGKSGRMLFRREDQLGAREQVTNCLQDATQISQWEIPKLHKDGTTIWVKEYARAIKRADGKWAVLIVGEDITWRKIAEEALRESEQRYRMLFERNLAGVYRGDLDGRILDCNDAYARLFGYEWREDILTHKAHELYFDTAEREVFIKLLKENGTLTSYEMKLRRKDGLPVWLLVNATLSKDPEGVPTIIEETLVDITERKFAEQALRDSESKFRAVAETTASAMTIHRDGNLVYVNPSAERISGYSKEELLRMNLAQILHPDSIPLYLERTRARERGEPIPLETEYKIIRKDGEERWLDFTFGGFVNIDSLTGIIGTAYDITDRKRAEELLIAEKERLSVTLRSIGDGVIATNTEGEIILLNRVAENLTGWRQEEALGKPLNEVFQIISAKTREPRQSPVEQILQSGQGVEFEDHTALIAKDETERIVADSIAPIYDKESKVIGLVLVFRDMTEELKREEELVRASKLESIALLAGGIAHDFNNILTAIMGNLSLTKRFIDPENQAYQRLHEAEQATWRAKDLTQQLLTFSSGGAPIKKTASVTELLQESMKFALTGSNVKGSIYLQEDLWLTEIDEGQINQVIHNLVLNARQAMPLGGTIEVRAENVLLKHGSTIQGAYLEPNKYVRITVQDPGTGMSEEHLRKIFDPYFTTKQKGSGLGLATSYSIIKNHNGYLFVESELGVGTTFSIYLLASEKRVAKKIALEEKPLSGKGKILIMDDEPVLRKMIGDMLNYLGYQSDASANGNEAIKLYEQAKEAGAPFDAVILDLTVPGGMGGAETAEKLRALDPHARCIVSSGYSTDPIMAEYKEHGFVAIIAKPYQIAELNDVLSRVVSDASEEN